MKKNKVRLLAVIYKVVVVCIVFICYSCVTVKEYEKVRINDPDMELASRKIKRFRTNFQAYREAAVGANGGKTGGGCGCN
ncbi:DUF4266 domain-containing protein [Aquimarina hainanensis]|uniref:DUF4266 domain-containing protein n=1 Tax=Aquimarina hainanensis TaxID=1578017 RepID=A0ABW5N6P1_9FLAO|nr:DUF4266 domain-containing protein [Aquimarina sp. TRL1]QKX05775.1 DUF4266 domain-containing protein [Aquimarina sp. TRL1]